MATFKLKKELLIHGYVRETAQSDVPNDIQCVILKYCKSCNVYSIVPSRSKRDDVFSQDLTHPNDFYAARGKVIILTPDNHGHTQIYAKGKYDSLGLLTAFNEKTLFNPILNKMCPDLKHKDISFLSTGPDAQCFFMVTTDNKLYVFGYNANFQLGINTNKESAISSDNIFYNNSENIFAKLHIPLTQNTKITSIHCRACSTLFLTSNGEVYGCGSNWNSELGFNPKNIDTSLRNDNRDILSPVKVDKLSGHFIIEIGGGGGYSLFLENNGILWHAGEDKMTSKGNIGCHEAILHPYFNGDCKNIKIKTFGCGVDHYGVVTMNGKCYIFMQDEDAALVNSLMVDSDKEFNVSNVYLRSEYTYILTESNDLYVCEHRNFETQIKKPSKIDKQAMGMCENEEIMNVICANTTYIITC